MKHRRSLRITARLPSNPTGIHMEFMLQASMEVGTGFSLRVEGTQSFLQQIQLFCTGRETKTSVSPGAGSSYLTFGLGLRANWLRAWRTQCSQYGTRTAGISFSRVAGMRASLFLCAETGG